MNKKCIFEDYREIQTIKNQLIDIIFVVKIFSDDLFRAAPYSLMLVLNKDALFHSQKGITKARDGVISVTLFLGTISLD